ncbi:MAG: OmpA/MotB [Rhizobacter sp.]|nr:OmpA/MotB [Rhizobacter sp.]
MKIRSQSLAVSLSGLALVALAPLNAHANIYSGVDFPAGISSFADTVSSYNPPDTATDKAPSAANSDTDHALGAPDYVSGGGCTNVATCTFASLGNGGSMTVKFTDNFLTGGGNSKEDLHVFEVGPSVEAMLVEISKDGSNWISVGSVAGSVSGIDLDAFGFGKTDFFSYVRLTDVYADSYSKGGGGSSGADIDAIGAVSSAPITAAVPEPGTYALMLAGLGLVGWISKRRKA